MSYILDALKKSQTQQNNEGVGVRLTPVTQKRGVPPIWVAVLAMALVINIGVLGWYLLGQDDSLSVASTIEPSTPATISQPARQSQAAESNPSSQAGPSENSVTQPALDNATESQPAPVRPRPVMPTRVPQSPATSTQSSSSPPVENQPSVRLPRVNLAELPAVERTLYDGFSFTSHIFTDDPDLCAVVIDGERLQAGDAFKGLKVVAITEVGVVFEENRRGIRRQVVVNPFE